MSVSHTPGPWRYELEGDPEWRGGCEHRVYVGADESPTEGWIDLSESVDTAPNARLIAAAPELLAVCVAAFEHLNINGQGGAPLRNALREAIAKADGSAVSS